MGIYQPFEVKYCPNSLLIADIHSHLLRSVEIMGLMGGIYDREHGTVWIKKCYPLKEDVQTDETVIACSVDTLKVRDMIKEDGLALVGWYHSHPNFENIPSHLDCYQHQSNKAGQHDAEQPYIGLIIESLWNTPNTSNCGGSDYRFFNTLPLNGPNDTEYIALQFHTLCKVGSNINDNDLMQEIRALIERYGANKYDLHRTNFGEFGDQIFENIAKHLSLDGIEDDENEKQIFTEKIKQIFMENADVWWVTNKPTKKDNDDKENENSLN